MDLKWVFSVEIVVVGLNLAVVVPEPGQIFSRLEDDEYWQDNTDHDILHEELVGVEEEHGLPVSEVAQAEHEVNEE